MHWFWRAMIAVGVAGAYGAVSVYGGLPYNVAEMAHQFTLRTIRTALGGYGVGTFVAVAVAYYLPINTLALCVYGLVTRRFARPQSDGETRCRKCAYILRGLTVPRCSECGEAI